MATHSRSVSGSRHVQRGAAALILACAAGLSSAQEPPIEFKGIVVGMPAPTEGPFTRLACRPRNEPTRTCFSLWDVDRGTLGPPETIAGANIRSLFATVQDDVVETVYIVFEPKNFDAVYEALKSKYPTLTCERSEVSTAMGARFDQQACSMKGANGSMLLNKRSGKVTESSLWLYSPAALARLSRERKKNASDL